MKHMELMKFKVWKQAITTFCIAVFCFVLYFAMVFLREKIA